MEAEALHDFVPKESTELAFRKGDKLLLLNYGDPVQWYNAEKDGQRGLVPGNYISIDPPSWYLGRIPRATAEKILQGNKHDGAFLVRLSESAPSEFSLSVKCGNSVQHFRILKDSESKYFLWNTRFNNLEELVTHYRSETVSTTGTVCLRDMDSDKQFVAVAMYDFESKKNGEEPEVAELEFKKGELITVFDAEDLNWWGGSIGERSGYFPRLYVTPYDPKTNNIH